MKTRHVVAALAALLLVVFSDIQQVATQSSSPSVSSVSGSVTHGGVVTVGGSGFGTKASAAPLKYDDFQSIGMGALISSSSAAGPAWVNNGGFGQKFNPVASSARLRSGTPFTRNMQSHWNPPDGSGASNIALVGQNFVRAYFDGWTYMDVSGVTSGAPNNFKPFRLHSAGASAPSANIASPVACSGNPASFVAAQRDGVAHSDTDWYDTTRANMMCNQWMHVQWMIDAGSGNGASNGSVISYINGRLDYNHVNVPTTGSGQTSWPEWYIGNYIRNDSEWSGDIYAYWENLYVDTSWARVEVGDNPTYANCTHREIQIPSAWSGSSISVRLNRGSFPSFSNLYLFVVNAQGTASSGFPLTGGGAPPPPPAVPASPTNLRVIP